VQVSNPGCHTSDSFYFVQDQLVLHNKVRVLKVLQSIDMPCSRRMQLIASPMTRDNDQACT
jgi:hypothetical protein